MKKYLNKVVDLFIKLSDRFLEVSFQRTEDKLMRKNK